MSEARVDDTDTGRAVAGDGWFVLNLAEASWERKGVFGMRCRFEAPERAPWPASG